MSQLNFNILSSREGEVANYLMEGKGTNFIAKELGIKANTVSTIKKKVFTKLGISSSVELYKLSEKK
jgi:two-component system, NarL family, invasion response regulator UvrY